MSRRIITLIFILAMPAWACADNDELSRVWSAPDASMKERAEAVNQAFTNGTPIPVIVAALGTNYVQCFSSATLWIGPGPEPPNTPWLSYRFGEEQVTIHTTASISEGPLKGNFTGAGYSIPVGTPKRTTDHIWIGKAGGNLPAWVTNSVKTTNGIWIGPKDGAAPYRSVTNQTYATNAMAELSLKMFADFERDPTARAAFISAFDDGYAEALKGGHGVICTFGKGGPAGIAKEIGYMMGQTSARRKIIAKETARLEELEKSK